MSVKGYVVTEKSIWVDEKNMSFQYEKGENLVEYTHIDEEFFINIWKQGELFEKLLEYGHDFTNNQCCGTIEMHYDIFLDMLEENTFEEENDKDSINIINKYFDEIKEKNYPILKLEFY